jgi:hypothetical protein
MRFITEFELANIVRPDYQYGCKERAKYDMGQLIQNIFDWKQKPFSNYDGEKSTRWSLEIEAFPMDKWVEFKSRVLSNFIDHDYEFAGEILMIIKELESFGKPAGAAKEQKEG